MTIINLTRMCKPERAEGIRRALEGKSYMKFRITLCPCQGEIHVNAETDYPADENEIKDMLLHLMACEMK